MLPFYYNPLLSLVIKRCFMQRESKLTTQALIWVDEMPPGIQNELLVRQLVPAPFFTSRSEQKGALLGTSFSLASPRI